MQHSRLHRALKTLTTSAQEATAQRHYMGWAACLVVCHAAARRHEGPLRQQLIRNAPCMDPAP